MPIPTEDDLIKISNIAASVVLKLRVMLRSDEPQEHRAELGDMVLDFVDRCMAFADACAER
jgi:hypothetical protein